MLSFVGLNMEIFMFSLPNMTDQVTIFLVQEKEKAALEEQEDVDPDIAAMMGFGGFGSSKK